MRKLNKSIYGLKEASKQWYVTFDKIVAFFGSKENDTNQCIYMMISGDNFVILVLYVDDILLTSNNVNVLMEMKLML